MANQNYGASLELQDKFSSVGNKFIETINKIISSTNTLTKDLEKLSQKTYTVEVNAIFSSNYHAVMAQMNHDIPANKVVHINAKDNVTHTINDINRNLLDARRGMQMNIGSNFGGFSGFSRDMTRAMGMSGRAGIGAAGISGAGAVGGFASGAFRSGANGASGLAGSIIGSGVIAGILGRNRNAVGNNTTNNTTTGFLLPNGESVEEQDARIQRELAASRRRNRNGNGNGNGNGSGNGDNNPEDELSRRRQRTPRPNYQSSWDTNQATMNMLTDSTAQRHPTVNLLQRQSQSMNNMFGTDQSTYVNKILGNRQAIATDLNGTKATLKAFFTDMKQTAIDSFNGIKNFGKQTFSFLGTAGGIIAAPFKRGFESIKTFASSVGSKIMSMTAKPRELVVRGVFAAQRLGSDIATAFGNLKAKAGEAAGHIGTSLVSGFNKVKGVFGSIGGAIGSGLGKVKGAFGAIGTAASATFGRPFRIMTSIGGTALSGIGKVASAAGKIGGKIFKATFSAVDKISSVIGSVMGKIAGLAKAAGGIVIGGVAAAGALAVPAVKGAIEQENNEVALKHFIGLANGTGAKSDQTVASTNEYMGKLNDMANRTPFSNAEILEAGRRAVNVTGGDTTGAMDLTNLAGNMAALNPGKSVMDAMEALADAKNGEYERMKEFGFKVTQDDIKKGGGTDAYFKNQVMDPNGKIGKTFANGADELSNTTAGKWSTFTGNAEAALTKFGKVLLPILNGPLSYFNDWFDKNSTTIDGWVQSFQQGINKIGTFLKPVGESLKKTFGDAFKNPEVKKNLDDAGKSIGNAFKNPQAMAAIDKMGSSLMKVIPAAVTFGSQIAKAFGPAVQPAIKMVATLVQVLSDAFVKFTQKIGPLLAPMGEIVGKTFNFIGQAIEACSPIIDVIINVVAALMKAWQTAWPLMSSIIQTGLDIIKPALQIIADVANIIVDVFELVWPTVVDILQKCWDDWKPVFDFIAGALQKIADFASGVVGWFDKLLNKAPDAKKAADDTNYGKGDSNYSQSTSDWGGGGDDGTPHATGLKRVPYDGYKAILHEGERVLTKNEVNGGAGSGVSIGNINLNCPNVTDATNAKELTNQVISEITKQLTIKSVSRGGVY